MRRRTDTDLMVGGAILAALVILIAGVLWLKEVSITRRLVSYTVLVPNVGSLQVGDPVKVNGVKMGSVGSIELYGSRVKVVIRLDRRVTLTNAAVVTVQNIGLMGERNIMIQLSDSGEVYLPDKRRPSDAPLLEGYFDSGIAEAMGMVGTVLGDIRVLVHNVEGIVNSTVGDSSFIVFFRTVVGRLDSLTVLLDQLVRRNRGPINESLDNVRIATAQIRRLLDDNRGAIDALLADGARLSAQAVRIATEVESLTVSLNSIVGSIERGEGTLGMLVGDGEFSRDLKDAVGRIDTLAGDVRDNGLKLRIRLGFRNRKRSN